MNSFLQFEFAGKIMIVPRRNAVESVQRALRGLGYYRGPATGTMNRVFEQALRKYQAESGTRNSGVVDGETIESLGLNPASFTTR
jgi:peptidoglycan hydrolase-like protein with peptidoglycan-binding domain